ncbi:MAG: LysR family transcriptional regulator AphB [Pseudoalteromonas rhizosphaerae]|jgi:LysR family transcriptional regulator AphB|uniref:LysR family transcriptional regulator n=1 Tax=Pseudoalteromonas neustonica TaxID=1840331 RepID=A0ABY3FBN1_9GAMM|nr:LysR family transcriptional regulator [Pseudoalteromonas neustonica]TVU82221.1 LysR family transcriptional regulator [Pseudoalteromonas neustonica]
MLDDLYLFTEVARRKSMSQTATALNLNLSTLSRRIQAFEQKLGTPLLQRSARGILLTSAGQHIYDSLANSVLTLSSQVEQVISKQNINEEFYLLCPQNLIAGPLMSAISAFHTSHAQLNLHIYPNNLNSQLSQQRFNLAIRIGEQQDSSFYQKRLGSIATAVITKKQTAPQNRLILPYTDKQLSAALLSELKSCFEHITYCYDITIARQLVQSGVGAGLLPMSEIASLNAKQQFAYVAQNIPLPARPIYAMWAHTRTPSATANKLITNIQQAIAEQPCLQGEIVPLGN